MGNNGKKNRIPRILYTSEDVRRAIIDVFSGQRGRRVAITAFVGDGAESYLPNPKGIELICWPKASGTNPNALRKLARKGVVIRFADSLHMKVYWSERRGAVVTSANLSTNALGAGDLKEFGVRLDRGRLDIQKVLASIRTRPLRDAELRRLDRQHAILMARQGGRTRGRNEMSFRTWYKSTARRQWKLQSWYVEVNQSKTAKAFVKSQYNIPSPESTLGCADRSFCIGDWILTCRIKNNKIDLLEWTFADHVVRLPRTDRAYDKDWPCEAVQVWPSRRYPSPPFRLDKRFTAGFKEAVKEYGIDRIENMRNGRPSPRLIELMAEYCS